MKQSQNSKYTVQGGKIINRQTRQAIPDNEPVFILRARDENARRVLSYYMECLGKSLPGLDKQYADFTKFAAAQGVKEPT
jgi:hypothetical protein